MYPYVAPHIAKIHAPITLGIRRRTKPLVFELRRRCPCGFDSHRPLHYPSEVDEPAHTSETFDCFVDASMLKERLHRVGEAIALEPSVIDDRRSILLCAFYVRTVERILRNTLVARGVLKPRY